MKPFFRLSLLVFTALASQLSLAQNLEEKAVETEKIKGIIKMNPVGIFGAQYQFGYEYIVDSKLSVQASLGYIGSRRVYNLDTLIGKSMGFVFIPELRYYPLKTGPKGFYVAGLLRIRYTSEKQEDQLYMKNNNQVDYTRQAKVWSNGLGVVAGYQFFKGRFTFDIFAGPQVKFVSEKFRYVSNGVSDSDFENKLGAAKTRERKGSGIRVGFNLGFSI